VGSLEVVCELSNGDRLVSDKITFWRYYFNGTEITIPSNDNQAELTLNSSSLSSPHFIIVMSTNALPGALPAGVKAIGLSHSFRSFVTTFNSEGIMFLNLFYQICLNALSK
jgi:hypothetical protein